MGKSLVASSTTSSCSNHLSLSATARLGMECSSKAETRSQCLDPCSICCQLKHTHFRSKNSLARRRSCFQLCSCSMYHLVRYRHHHSNWNLLRRQIQRGYGCDIRWLIPWNTLYLLSRDTCSQLSPIRSICFLEQRKRYRSKCCLRRKRSHCQGHFGSKLHHPRHRHRRSNESLPHT